MANVSFFILCGFNCLLLIHVLQEIYLLGHALLAKKREIPPTKPSVEKLPFVTIQLPLYNEKYVIKRLMKSIDQLNYPKDKLEVQLLDDSNDETSSIIQKYLSEKENPHFKHIQRADRKGFKAGALDHGLREAKGEMIAIFDADFIPSPDFQLETIPYFENPKIGLVQTRWTYVNENDSILTKAQALMLNTHFSVEHIGRLKSGGFINFNGTAGVWRREAIESSGGWHADTLTEDLDLSFRAQIKGWEFKYLFNSCSPSELPVTFEAFRTQQFRWSKGAAECLRKNTLDLWQSNVNLAAKLIGTFHLLNSSIYLLVVGILFFSPAVYYFEHQDAITTPLFDWLSWLGPTSLSLLFTIFLAGSLFASSNKLRSILLFVPTLLVYFSMATGISLYMVLGIMEGYFGKKSEFIRTPKFGTGKKVLERIKRGYAFKKAYSLRSLEAIFLGYGAFWVIASIIDFNPLSFSYGFIVLFGFSLALFWKNKTLRFFKR